MIVDSGVSNRVSGLRTRMLHFLREEVVPNEPSLLAGGPEAAELLENLRQRAREVGLWALPHSAELGGGGVSLTDYVYLGEVEGRSEYGPAVFGSESLLDVLTLDRHADPVLREKLLRPLVDGALTPSYGMSEPEVAGSDPSQMRTWARLEKGSWLITGRKWFNKAANADFLTVMCRTGESEIPDKEAFSLVVVPTNAEGFEIVRELPVLGMHGGHCEVRLNEVWVPEENMLGRPGDGYTIASERLSTGRILRCLRWLGQAQRALELMCERLVTRNGFEGQLCDKQLMQQHVFDSYAEIQAARVLVARASRRLHEPFSPATPDADDGASFPDSAQVSSAVDVSTAKVVASRMVQRVTDRAIQVFGAEGLTDDTPLSVLFRLARAARIYDGPDEVHVQTVARHILKHHHADRPLDYGPA